MHDIYDFLVSRLVYIRFSPSWTTNVYCFRVTSVVLHAWCITDDPCLRHALNLILWSICHFYRTWSLYVNKCNKFLKGPTLTMFFSTFKLSVSRTRSSATWRWHHGSHGYLTLLFSIIWSISARPSGARQWQAFEFLHPSYCAELIASEL